MSDEQLAARYLRDGPPRYSATAEVDNQQPQIVWRVLCPYCRAAGQMTRLLNHLMLLPVGFTRCRHCSQRFAAALSPDGRRLATITLERRALDLAQQSLDPVEPLLLDGDGGPLRLGLPVFIRIADS